MATSAFMPNNRDSAVLKMAHDYGAVSVDLIRRRFWQNQTAGARAACYRRTALLVDAGFLTSTRLPALGGRGSGKTLLTLGLAGRQFLADTLDVPLTELRRVRLQSPSAFEHHLNTCSIRLSLEMACERSPLFTLDQWTPDGGITLRIEDPETKRNLNLVPDGSFTLAISNDIKQTFYLEYDRGTLTDPKRLKAKLRGYLSLSRHNPVPLLWVVPDSRRQAVITELVRTVAAALKTDPSVFWLAPIPAISEHTFLTEPIWNIVSGPTVAFTTLVPGRPDPSPVRPLGSLTFQGATPP